MLVPSLDAAVEQVLANYAAPLHTGRRIALGNHHGFSGARLWRIEGPPTDLCLRAWPPGDPSSERLRWIHQLMIEAQRAGRSCVPLLFATRDAATGVEHGGRLWELTAWMPGRADYREHPAPARLEAACVELARLHLAWGRGAHLTNSRCPAVERRLLRANEWQERLSSGWRGGLQAGIEDPLRLLVERASRQAQVWAGRVPQLLASWSERQLPLQPCLCDVWHDHVLYEGERVSGLIDYGGVKIDHVSVDLARLLGSMVEDDPAGWAVGLKAYASVRSLSQEEEALARVLDLTGVIVGAITWLRWLLVEGRVLEDRSAAAGRLAALVQRMEKW